MTYTSFQFLHLEADLESTTSFRKLGIDVTDKHCRGEAESKIVVNRIMSQVPCPRS